MITYTRTVDDRPVRIVADPDPGTFHRFTATDSLFGLDVETTPVQDDGPRFFGPDFGVRLVQFATEDEAMVLRAADPEQRRMAETLLTNQAARFVTHTNFDVLAVWSAFGIPLGQRVADTHLLACLIEPGETADHGLKSLTERHIDGGLRAAEDDLHTLFRAIAPPTIRGTNQIRNYGWTHVPIDAEPYIVYAGLDAIYVRRLLDRLAPLVADMGHLPRIEMWLAAQTTALTIRGIRLDVDYTTALARQFDHQHRAARARLEAMTGYPAASPKRVDWLAARGVTFTVFTDRGRPSLSSKDGLPDLLTRYPDGEVGDMLRACMDLATTSNFANNLKKIPGYADAYGRVHPDYKTLAAHTGRMSVKYPAMQTLKKNDPRLRGCFIAEPGHVLVGCDFANVELRLAAALSGDPEMVRVFREGQDVHNNTARMLFGPDFTKDQRRIAKALNFGTAYGGGAPGLAKQAGIPLEAARNAVARFRKAYPGITKFGRAMADRDPVRNAARRRIPADPGRAYANSNYSIQSTARDLLVESVYRLCVAEGYHPYLWALIHDEIVIQVPADHAEHARTALARSMTTTFRGVPITADAEIIGTRWGGKP
ncbi:DNA polymerase [Micromonospora sp. WMMD1102]|uniref:DNA polymerase n=1 Tax=Micromonospora sp. WMMD1102 TaxID=3016105 RepID=UPI00241564E9|nr:DNA polymerase [Micromonospora sp. WMMD1102]MDG4790014.1 DNA polymerase [Micromonospora sp. WMMD1102]